MSDLISRQDAINGIHKYFVEEINKTPYTKDEDGDEVYTDMPTVNSLLGCNKELAKRIKSLPSAKTDMSEYCDRLWKIAYERGKAESKAEWIPCSERLPEERGEYLVSYHTNFIGECMDIMRYGKPLMPADESDKQRNCFYDTSYDGFDCVCHEVTAWMPLPEPYREDGEV